MKLIWARKRVLLMRKTLICRALSIVFTTSRRHHTQFSSAYSGVGDG